ncbi:MAG: hypothetical protein U0736_25760 [Gemmataceae bacterium]
MPLLYDPEADPGETTNRVEQHPDVVRRLQQLAARARADLGDARDDEGHRRSRARKTVRYYSNISTAKQQLKPWPR